MLYQIIDEEGYCWGLFPTRSIAGLALKGIRTFADEGTMFQIQKIAAKESV